MAVINRRMWLGGAVGGFFAYAQRNQLDGALRAAPRAAAKRCVVLWMNGGPSQIDTFDPKPGDSTAGEFQPISTAAPGVAISETLPHLAKQMDSLAVIRNLTSSEGEHERGQYYLHTGFQFVPGFPRPALGSVVSHESEPTDFPRFVSIGSRGFGPAYMGPDHAPFAIENPEQALQLMRSIRRRSKRLSLLQDLGETFDSRRPVAMVQRRRSMVSRVQSLVSTPFVDAFDIERVSQRERNRYGGGPSGRACLIARRLLETGVNFVEVQQDGWDTHQNNFRRTRELCEAIDRPWAALIEDLKSSGLWEETIVLWMGEFGRTPNINAQRGRDHFPQVTPAVIGGGGLRGGLTIGKTSRTGLEIDGASHQVADLFATVFKSLGIDPAAQFTTGFDSPTAATNKGVVIDELF
ncbi:MAG: DUF1501 domain-containing protein [Pirellulaceae bacterium]|jgi:hypothetical protein|nr:DUF1501 domain-containing protein [Pirellulaceae bacterium]MDP7016396.1 DUF1501 domain-containing protein [Pirellulaceae bacterium]